MENLCLKAVRDRKYPHKISMAMPIQLQMDSMKH